MLFVLSGPSYVGKKTSITHFMKLYSFSSIIPYTTKPDSHRIRETEGIQYHYVDEKSRSDIENSCFIYDKPFSFNEYKEDTLYAYKKSDIQNAIESYSNFIIHASVGNVRKMYEAFSKYHKNHDKYNNNSGTQQIYFIFLNFDSELTEPFFKQKIAHNMNINGKNIRHTFLGTISHRDNQENSTIESFSFKRRFSHAKKEIQFYKEHSSIFDALVKSDKPYEICEKLEKVILPKLRVMPTSPDKIPGPLSNMDIIYMLEKRKEDPLEIDINGQKATKIEIEGLLCGCGMHISLSEIIRRVSKKPINAFIDMADSSTNIEMLLEKSFPTKRITKGYVMCPHEVIFCSSDELIKLPHDVYAIVASKFSYTQLGLSIELSTSIIQSGHHGKIHFQIKNNTDNYICIYPHIQVAQILFFRTIQPSTKIYHDDKNNSYDRESYPPLTKFRNNNTVLDNAEKPQSKILKGIIAQLKDKMIINIVGILTLIFLCLTYGPKLIEVTQKYLIPNFEKLPIAIYVVLFALVSCLANTIIHILGVFICKTIELILYYVHKVHRHSNDE